MLRAAQEESCNIKFSTHLSVTLRATITSSINTHGNCNACHARVE